MWPAPETSLFKSNQMRPITTCVFDAYGTLFDVSAAARAAVNAFAEHITRRLPELISMK